MEFMKEKESETRTAALSDPFSGWRSSAERVREPGVRGLVPGTIVERTPGMLGVVESLDRDGVTARPFRTDASAARLFFGDVRPAPCSERFLEALGFRFPEGGGAMELRFGPSAFPAELKAAPLEDGKSAGWTVSRGGSVLGGGTAEALSDMLDGAARLSGLKADPEALDWSWPDPKDHREVPFLDFWEYALCYSRRVSPSGEPDALGRRSWQERLFSVFGAVPCGAREAEPGLLLRKTPDGWLPYASLDDGGGCWTEAGERRLRAALLSFDRLHQEAPLMLPPWEDGGEE